MVSAATSVAKSTSSCSKAKNKRHFTKTSIEDVNTSLCKGFKRTESSQNFIRLPWSLREWKSILSITIFYVIILIFWLYLLLFVLSKIKMVFIFSIIWRSKLKLELHFMPVFISVSFNLFQPTSVSFNSHKDQKVIYDFEVCYYQKFYNCCGENIKLITFMILIVVLCKCRPLKCVYHILLCSFYSSHRTNININMKSAKWLLEILEQETFLKYHAYYKVSTDYVFHPGTAIV